MINGSDLRTTGIFLGVFALLSIVSTVVTIADKLRAKNHRWRVPENTLLLIAAIGGALSMLVTMLIIRHKTQHRKFMVGLPIIVLFQLIILLWCNYRLGQF